MNFNWLQDFLALAEIRNFTRAAERRSISQAAFSRRIKSLESWLGTILVERAGSGVYLTHDGRLFEQEAREILQRLTVGRGKLSARATESRRPVTIAMSQNVAISSFPKLWSQWSSGLPIYALTRIGDIGEAVADLLTGHAEILCCHRSVRLPVLLDLKDIQSHVVQEDRFVPIVGTNSELAKKLNRKREWEQVPLIRYAPNRYFAELVDSIIEQAPFDISGPNVVLTEMSDVVCNCVASGMGVGWLPQSVATGRKDITVIDEPSLSMDMEMVAFIGKHVTSHAAHDVWKAICSN